MAQLSHVHFVQAYISLLVYQPDFTGMNYSMTHQEYQQHMFPAITTGRRVSLDCRNTEMRSTIFINWHIYIEKPAIYSLSVHSTYIHYNRIILSVGNEL